MSSLSFSALRIPNVRRVIASQLLSQICDKLMLVAVMWVIADKYSAAWMPWFVAAGGLPHLLLAGFSGRLIARIKILPAVIGSEIFRGVLLLAFPFIVTSETPPVESLIVLTCLINFGSAIFNPAILSLPLFIADDDSRPQVNAMIDGCFSIANVIGPVLSVMLFAYVGLGGLIFINGMSYLVAGLIQAGVRLNKLESDTAPAQLNLQPSEPTSLKTILKREHLLRQMLITFLGINIFGAPFVMIFPLYVKHIYKLDLAALATLESFFGAGAIAGAIGLSVFHFSHRLGPKIVRSILMVGVALVAFALSRTLVIGSAALFAMGLSLTVANVWILTLFQSAVDPKEVPSVMGLVNLVSVAATPLSLGLVGLFIHSFPIDQIALTSSLAFLAIGCALLLIPRLKEV